MAGEKILHKIVKDADKEKTAKQEAWSEVRPGHNHTESWHYRGHDKADAGSQTQRRGAFQSGNAQAVSTWRPRESQAREATDTDLVPLYPRRWGRTEDGRAGGSTEDRAQTEYLVDKTTISPLQEAPMHIRDRILTELQPVPGKTTTRTTWHSNSIG